MINPWTPIYLPYGSLSNWYDSTDLSTITLSSGNTVAQWRDKSYDANNLSEAVYTELPLYGTTTINGLSTVDFDGGSAINLDDGSITPLDTSSDHYMIYAGFNNSWVSTSTLFTFTNETNDGFYIRTTGEEYSQCILKDGSSDMKLSVLLGGAPNYNRNVIYTLDSVGNNVSLTLNYTNTAAATKASGDPDPFTKLTLGAHDDGFGEFNILNGQIGEFVLVQQDSMTTLDKQKLEGYIAHKWGMVSELPADHPYKAAAPTVTDVEYRNKLHETSTEEGSSRFRRLFTLGLV